VLRWARQLACDLADLAYPGRCVACGAHLDRGHRLCIDCDYALTLLELRDQCFDCGAPIAGSGFSCQRCSGRGYRSIDNIVRLGVFDSPLKELVTRFKYYHGWPVGELLADRAAGVLRVRKLLEETDVLVPVPLHPVRQVVRGFNQSMVLARGISRWSGVPVRDVAIRIRHTDQQAMKHKRERTRNVKNAFALVRPRAIAGKRVTVVDDVFTTAATVKELARELRRAGPAEVNLLAIATADPKHHAFVDA
jgi:competence protein ComFC